VAGGPHPAEVGAPPVSSRLAPVVAVARATPVARQERLCR
jgi:hypothetical protein